MSTREKTWRFPEGPQKRSSSCYPACKEIIRLFVVLQFLNLFVVLQFLNDRLLSHIGLYF